MEIPSETFFIEESSEDDVFERTPDNYSIEDQKYFYSNDEHMYFVLKKSMILEEWKKRRIEYEKKKIEKQMDYSYSNDAPNLQKDKLLKVFEHSYKNKFNAFRREQQRRVSTPFVQWQYDKLKI
jgi:hypothetical protein